MSLESPFGSESPKLGESGSVARMRDLIQFDVSQIGKGGAQNLATISGFEQEEPGSAGGASMDVVGSAWDKLLGFLGVPSIEDVIAMVLGLLLVAAGIFLFKPVRDTAIAAGMTAAKAAVVA